MSDLIDRDIACQKMTALYEEDCKIYGVPIPECFDSDRAIKALNELPSAEPVIYCKDCVRHNVSVEDWYNNYELKVCPLVAHRGKAIGHEFDYQFCVCAERRTDE